MNKLFLKIFLGFWATVILIGVAFVLSFALGPKGSYLPWQNMQSIVRRVRRELDSRGTTGAAALLADLERSEHLEACLYDQNTKPIAGNRCPSFQEVAQEVVEQTSVYRSLLRIKTRDGKTYILAAELPFGPGVVHRTILGLATHAFLALLVSSMVCYLLTLRLTQPILRLREASKQIAEGDLGARVGVGVEKRGDEIGDLAKDFNAMAGRIEGLLSSQRQLISDVSHELRSPLSRINLALDLARRRLGNDSAFDRMDTDIERLNEMLGRLLTMARLESGAAPIASAAVDLGRLVAEIVEDAGLEARERGCAVVCECTGEFQVMGDESLLRSAIENVVRNGIYYTAAGTEVRVELGFAADSGGKMLALAISDRGPGVPEADTENIFKPFFRVADARDRQSGGAGLGLAIAARVVELHRGRIVAENREGGGLRVRLELPAG